jgi:hypothetical protein
MGMLLGGHVQGRKPLGVRRVHWPTIREGFSHANQILPDDKIDQFHVGRVHPSDGYVIGDPRPGRPGSCDWTAPGGVTHARLRVEGIPFDQCSMCVA